MKNPAQVRRRPPKKNNKAKRVETRLKFKRSKFKMALEIQTKAGKWKVDLLAKG